MNEHITKILNGKGLAAKIRMELKGKIAKSGKKPGLGVVLVGVDPASQMYVNFKTQASQEVGMVLESCEFEEDISQKKLLRVIDKLNRNKKIHGILVQLPLPAHINQYEILEAIDPRKDVDGFHPANVGWLSIGKPYFMPATTRGIWTLVKSTPMDVRGKHVVMVGASNIVGKPTAQLFLNHGATVTICHKLTEGLAEHTKRADILITATGVANLITADMVKQGVMVIDAGISKHKGRVVGDVDYETVFEKAAYITPVPGGVGPMTVASLLQNTWLAMCRIEGMIEK
ncbi:MAG: bifunctional 5,10-methylenetetrahydrofolate dehydrogenase/5,10-methenyltetrahydrofolate cyclohydrolase [Candidatus Kerfeldbacteria bacterium]|nr:bifunctional 5,10-methylenetetrahydrofolate dehydrogenase/5,10-methenyltetrahydrofolate cyclohydrolase [Candidatus Kerfeldbacteria bacterium]